MVTAWAGTPVGDRRGRSTPVPPPSDPRFRPGCRARAPPPPGPGDPSIFIPSMGWADPLGIGAPRSPGSLFQANTLLRFSCPAARPIRRGTIS